MQPQLGVIVIQLEAAQERLHRLEKKVPDARWGARSDPARWSVGECIAHLNLTSKAYIPLLRDAYAKPLLVAGAPPRLYRRDFMGWMLSLTAGNLPRLGRRRFGRVRTIPAFVPGASDDRATIVTEFDALQRQLIELTRAAEERPLELMRIVSPFDSRISYNAYSCLVILPRHQQRHLWQAENVWNGA